MELFPSWELDFDTVFPTLLLLELSELLMDFLPPVHPRGKFISCPMIQPCAAFLSAWHSRHTLDTLDVHPLCAARRGQKECGRTRFVSPPAQHTETAEGIHGTFAPQWKDTCSQFQAVFSWCSQDMTELPTWMLSCPLIPSGEPQAGPAWE